VAESASLKPVIWIGSSRSDLRAFPKPVKDVVGYALYVAQQGGKHPDAKPLNGFGGAGVLEILEDYRGDTYRAVYTVPGLRSARFPEKSQSRHQDPEA
jgi:phage-related protein